MVATERQARGAQHPFVVMDFGSLLASPADALRVTRRNAESDCLGMRALRLLAPDRMLLCAVCGASTFKWP
jgi:hypothetical protein